MILTLMIVVFFSIEDTFKGRTIYVWCRHVGRSQQFTIAHNINSIIDVSSFPEVQYIHQTSRIRNKVFANLVHIVKLIIHGEGPLVICCRNGRTRSPACLAAYLLISYCMSTEVAYRYLTGKMLAARPLLSCDVDSDSRFTPHLRHFENLLDDGCSTGLSSYISQSV